jgi:hypothetical protein
MIGTKNPSVNVVWPTMKPRSRAAALTFAGVHEDRARAYAMMDWADLPSNAKSQLIQGWNMGEIGGTTRRYAETTRRMPVLTNPVSEEFKRRVLDQFEPDGVSKKTREIAHLLFGKYPGDKDQRAVAKALEELARAGALHGELHKEYDYTQVRGGHFGASKIAMKRRRWRWYLPDAKRPSGLFDMTKGGVKRNPCSRRNSTKGAYPFKDKTEQYRQLEIGQLLHAQRDAMRAARAMRGHDLAAENWYMDDFFTISDEITRRRHGLKNKKRSHRNSDLKDLMIAHVKDFFGSDVDDNDIEVAIYWFASNYHGGQWSELYSILSTSPYKPGMFSRGIKSEEGMVPEIYSYLCKNFAPKRSKKNPSSAPTIWRKHRHGKRTTHFRGPDPQFKVYYVAQFRPAYPRKGTMWVARTVIDALPPTVVGKVYKIAARSAVAAIREARGF